MGAESGADEAVMALTTDAAVSTEVIDQIAAGEDFFAGHSIDL